MPPPARIEILTRVVAERLAAAWAVSAAGSAGSACSKPILIANRLLENAARSARFVVPRLENRERAGIGDSCFGCCGVSLLRIRRLAAKRISTESVARRPYETRSKALMAVDPGLNPAERLDLVAYLDGELDEENAPPSRPNSPPTRWLVERRKHRADLGIARLSPSDAGVGNLGIEDGPSGDGTRPGNLPRRIDSTRPRSATSVGDRGRRRGCIVFRRLGLTGIRRGQPDRSVGATWALPSILMNTRMPATWISFIFSKKLASSAMAIDRPDIADRVSSPTSRLYFAVAAVAFLLGAAASLTRNLEQLRSLPLSRRKALAENLARFQRMDSRDQEIARRFDRRIDEIEDPEERRRLLDLLNRYHSWVEQLPEGKPRSCVKPCLTRNASN